MQLIRKTVAGAILGALMATTALAQEMTEFGTPRNETLIVQTFDGRSANPGQMNPLNSYVIWRGFRELAWGYLWEMDTATGQSYPELADGFPEVLNEDHTRFRVKIRPGVYWSDGEEFTVDDMIYTMETAFKYRDQLTNVSNYTNFLESWTKIDDYTIEIQTQRPSYDFVTRFGVYTWGSQIVWLPEHVFAPLGDDVVTFQNQDPVVLGPYTVRDFDPNGFWQVWERREDWERSSWGSVLGEPIPQFVVYKDFGTEDTRSLAFVQNQYDIDTFMSPDTISAAQGMSDAIETFSPTFPFHDMNDACGWGIYFNQQLAPFDQSEVRWALALSLDLQQVGITALSGQFEPTALPVPDTPVTRPLFHEPLYDFLDNLTLADGYKPFNPNFNQELVQALLDQGVDPALLPSGDAINDSFGHGWWNHDVAQAETLLASVGIVKGDDGFYMTPDGEPWVIDFVYPGDWNKVLQRIGFSVTDSWRQAGFNVNGRQVDSAEFGTYQTTNARNQVMIHWNQQCVFNANWLNNWRTFNPDNVMPVESTDPLVGNFLRITDQEIFDIVQAAATVPSNSPEMVEMGQQIMRRMVEEMMLIPLMSIPTTIPTNNTYWTNYPKADNFYALPYTWWSSFKQTLVNIRPAGE